MGLACPSPEVLGGGSLATAADADGTDRGIAAAELGATSGDQFQTDRATKLILRRPAIDGWG